MVAYRVVPTGVSARRPQQNCRTTSLLRRTTHLLLPIDNPCAGDVMVGVSYGKGATLQDDAVRWLTPEEVEERLERHEKIRLFDARDEKEYEDGSLPGAESLAQSSLMFTKDRLQPLLDDLVSNHSTFDDLVFFANTAGPNAGMTAGREVFIMCYLQELGVPLASMARLSGGLHGWKATGRPTPPSGRAATDAQQAVSGLPAFLESTSLGHLQESLAALTLEAAAAACLASRTDFLAALKDEYGLSKLPERQALCKALQKAVREGRVSIKDDS